MFVYSVGASYYGGPDSGTFSMVTSVAKKNLQESLDIITEEFTKLVEEGVSKEELEFVNSRSIKSKKAAMQTSGSWVAFHADDELYGKKNKLTLPEYLKKVNDLTVKDIERVSKKYLVKNTWYLAMCGDITDKEITINF